MHKTSDVLNNGKDSYIAYYSRRLPSCYAYKNGKVKISALPLKGGMETVLDIMNSQVIDVFYDHMKRQSVGSNVDIFKIKQDGLQISITRGVNGFGYHNDCNDTNRIKSTKRATILDSYMPFEREVMVVTLILCVDKFGNIVDEKKSGCKITWKYHNEEEVEESGKHCKLGEIITDGLSMHVQFPNVQYLTQHKADSSGRRSKKYEEGTFSRIVLSSRYTYQTEKGKDPPCKQYALYRNCVNDSNACGKAVVVDGSQDNATTELPVAKRDIIITKAPTTALSTDNELMKLVKRPPASLEVPGSSSLYCLRSLPVFMKLLTAGMSLEIEYSKKTIPNQTYFGMGIPIGEIKPSDEVRKMLKLNIAIRGGVAEVCHNEYHLFHGICLEEPYKNGVRNMIKFAKLVMDCGSNKKKLRKELNKLDKKDYLFWVGPKGGNYQSTGVFPNESGIQKDSIAQTAMAGQISKAIYNVCAHNNVLESFHIPYQWLLDKNESYPKAGRSKRLINLGPVVGHSVSVEKIEHGPQYVEHYGSKASWTTVPNPVYMFHPLFHSENKMPINFFTQWKHMKEKHVKVHEKDEIKVATCRQYRPKTIDDFENVHPNTITAKWINKLISPEKPKNHSPKPVRDLNKEGISVQELVNENIRASVSSFGRLLRLNVDEKNKISFLPIVNIGMVHGVYSIPSPCRTYQLPTAMIISCCGQKQKNGTNYRLKEREDLKTTSDFCYLIMAIIVVRTSGNPLLFKQFADYVNASISTDKQVSSKTSIMLPNTKNLFREFILFLEEGEGKGQAAKIRQRGPARFQKGGHD